MLFPAVLVNIHNSKVCLKGEWSNAFAAAYLIRAKICIQELWMMGQDWDQELPQEIRRKWSEFSKAIEHLNAVEFPRCLTPLLAIATPVLCVFADTSKKLLGLVLPFDGRSRMTNLSVDSLLLNPELHY